MAISWATVEQQRRGLDLLLGHLPNAEREAQRDDLLRAEANGKLSLEHFLIATSGDEIVGGILLLPQADGTTLIWPPVVPRYDSEQKIEDALFAACRSWLDQSDAVLGQCLLDQEDVAEQMRLSRQGFPHLTNLAILIRDLQSPLLPCDIQLTSEAYCAENDERFVRCIEETYVGSLDCPELKGLRSGRDALEGHRQAGVHDPDLWRIFSDGTRDVAVLLLSDHPDQNLCELVYLGVIPEARGCGYGQQIVVGGLHTVRNRDRAGLFLAVDEENHYAVNLYEQVGFVLASRKAVHARFIRDVKSG